MKQAIDGRRAFRVKCQGSTNSREQTGNEFTWYTDEKGPKYRKLYNHSLVLWIMHAFLNVVFNFFQDQLLIGEIQELNRKVFPNNVYFLF